MYILSSIGRVPLVLKKLDTNKKRSKGFMGWSKSPNNFYGLLFSHLKPRTQSYWMKGVPFDLEALGFDSDDKLVEIIQLKSLSKASISFSKAVKDVVEVRSGWCQENGIEVGCRLIKNMVIP